MSIRTSNTELHDARAKSSRYESTLDSTRRKALGQFFTGLPLGRLLAAISLRTSDKSVIDPMSGHGDLLDAVAERASVQDLRLKHLHGVEIDSKTADLCLERLENWGDLIPDISVRTEDAFNPHAAHHFLKTGYDLVIANPPYVRYQTLAARGGNIPQLPPGEIRKNLASIVASRVPSPELYAWRMIIEEYSGLADLSVPAWILCASLVKDGGTLALVAPATWRSRSYGTIIEYLLSAFFEVEYLIEDTQPGWFSDALVRTQLVVARRTGARLQQRDRNDDSGVITVKISPSANGNGSLVGSAFSGSDPEVQFAEWVRDGNWADESRAEGILVQRSFLGTPLRGKPVKFSGEFGGNGNGSLFRSSEESSIDLIPSAIRAHFAAVHRVDLVLPEAAGLFISQGLRTGCNGFFYADFVSRRGNQETIRLSQLFGNEEIKVPESCVRPVVRSQSDVNGSVIPEALQGRVLDLSAFVLPEDEKLIRAASRLYSHEGVEVPHLAPPELAAYIRRAAETIYTTGAMPKRIPELSAVRTNVRAAGADKPPRFWYMLPPFARRHCPDAFIARINQGIPWVEINSDPPVLIDANFSTIWSEPHKWTQYSIRAFFNSAWCRACMEALGTPLGGGALKLEAVQLRRLPVPVFSGDDLSFLDVQGRSMSRDEESVSAAVDRFIIAKMMHLAESDSAVGNTVAFLNTISKSLSRERQRKGA